MSPPTTPLERPAETDVVARELAALAERLVALDLSAEIQPLDELLPGQDFRGLVDPAPSFEDAFRKLRELQIQDIYSYMITQGRYAFGISLGVYSPESTAFEAQQSMKAKDIR